ncbi:hypothetical protein FRC07_000955 [Ceratobasidium sp. 392]|nr:hypothetical protein FRC07_000955 [Ceratobasidium sp. 392]
MFYYFRCYGKSSTIAIVVVHEYNCAAIVTRPDSSEVAHVSLNDYSFGKARGAHTLLLQSLRSEGRSFRGVSNKSTKKSAKSAMEQILKELWTGIAEPILESLGYMNPPPNEELPHITWCPTGPLTFLPLHAAGDHESPGRALLDYAVSSYTPNLTSLLVAPLTKAASSGLAAVGQSATHGLKPLPNTGPELDQIGLLANRIMPFTRLDGQHATSQAVLDAMERHSWVHLACHASQNPNQPTASAFHIHDGPLDLATITRKQLKNADLAFLSACQTATGDYALPEESMHLAAGMIMAGYRRVIATMWSIEDEDAPLVVLVVSARKLNIVL